MDKALKQRLVGASVLIALAVVVLPMLLGGRPGDKTQQAQKIELPPQPAELDFETRRYPVGEKAPASPDSGAAKIKPLPTPADSAVEVPAPPAPDPGPGVAETMQSPEETPGAEATPEATAEEPATLVPAPQPPSGQGGRYIVQVASFGAIDNANRLSETLRGYGYDVMSDTVKSEVGTLHRVRVGPYVSESEANRVVSRLQTQVGDIRPRVMDLQPEKSTQVTQPSDPLMRWVVQVGSFSSAGNADKLVARLRLESLAAFKEEVSRSGSTVYRVRIGPFLEREDAIQAERRVSERLSIDGVVMSAD